MKALIKDMDVHMFMDMLKNKKKVNHGFFNYQVDAENWLKNVFWLDSLIRRSYALFGHILSFNTTYKIRRYSMVFAAFIGLNHHMHLICFGVGLLRDEKVQSFL